MAINEIHQNEWVTIGHCTIAIINVLHSHENKFQQPKEVTKQAWQLTSQPATIVARSEGDGSVTLTALDFRDHVAEQSCEFAFFVDRRCHAISTSVQLFCVRVPRPCGANITDIGNRRE